LPSASPLVINLGSGPLETSRLPGMFKDWRQIRVDADIAAHPDIVSDIVDLSKIESGTVSAVWSAHCFEHLYSHQITPTLVEIYRVLNDDGFLCIIVPDLQAIAQFLVSDRLHEVIYQSPAGPVTAHDVLFGFGPAIALGHTMMAHRCGFAPTLLLNRIREVPFAEIVARRRPNLFELAGVARKKPARDPDERAQLLRALEL